ncbi:uncharacterized protein LOC124632254 [Helicoverpa zea]|uniref:uncharacterized protein LOC124632254 n=1 Tax=Helicoverpa zea TaxID=7113 RepID=UPI001F58AE77|nr:uncharacterized protein LOC124632254 [Helicoverpa zea]
MSRYHFIISVCVAVSYAVYIAADNEALATNDESRDTELVRRCFHFTWLGPRWNNNSVFLNATCQDATRLASGVPCVEPLVVSYDGTWPDVEYIWRNHLGNASCILANNDVCAQYTYYFDGHVDNSTYLCTRAIDSNGQAITSGCHEQRNGSYVTRACFCQSVEGGFPCNDAVVSKLNTVLFTLFSIVVIFNFNVV